MSICIESYMDEILSLILVDNRHNEVLYIKNLHGTGAWHPDSWDHILEYPE